MRAVSYAPGWASGLGRAVHGLLLTTLVPHLVAVGQGCRHVTVHRRARGLGLAAADTTAVRTGGADEVGRPALLHAAAALLLGENAVSFVRRTSLLPSL